MTRVTCRLTAKNRDQLRNATLGNRVWAAYIFLTLYGVRQMYMVVRPQTNIQTNQKTAHHRNTVTSSVHEKLMNFGRARDFTLDMRTNRQTDRQTRRSQPRLKSWRGPHVGWMPFPFLFFFYSVLFFGRKIGLFAAPLL